jgi:competence protein ComEC
MRYFWMNKLSWIALCVAYIVGLGMTGLPIGPFWSAGLIIILGSAIAFMVQRIWPGYIPVKLGGVAIGIALLGLGHYQLRIPQASAQDVSQFVPVLESANVTVRGQVEELPRLTQNGQMQIWLQVQGLDVGPIAPQLTQSPDLARGRLYVTLPQAVGADVYPGQQVSIGGSLYAPQVANNPGGFDFQKFLQAQNCFAGFRGETLTPVPKPLPAFSLWQIQRRIVRSQAAGLPHPEGPLVSAMVLGGKVVDLPFELKTEFARIGLSHALAASGFQVTLILGVVLVLTQKLSRRQQVIISSICLLVFLGLTGLQPSVCRAVVMGFAVLFALLQERRVDPLGSLLFAVTFLLVLSPLWIWDLGFQLSVLATLGLVVTVPWLTIWFEWLPTVLASAIVVPLAALIWTLPLQLWAFGVVSPYCLIANVLAAPLITVISLGAMLNALIAVIWPLAGTFTAQLLHYPTWALLALVHFVVGLPGSTIALGTLPLVLMVILYGLLGMLWYRSDWQRYGWAFGLAGAVMVWLPSWQWQGVTQITALVTTDQPVLVVQSEHHTGLVNSGRDRTASMTVLPFLQQQGVNRLDWAIDFTSAPKFKPDTDRPPVIPGWSVLRDRLPIERQVLPVQASINLGRSRVERLSQDPDAIALKVAQAQWLLLGTVDQTKQSELLPTLTKTEVLWWTGGKLRRELLRQVQPKVAIATGKKLDRATADWLQQQGARVYWLKRDGAIQWQPQTGFRLMGGAKEALL